MTMARVAAVVGGLVVLGLALLISVGTAAVALLALGLAAAIQRRRGQRLGVFPALWVAVITMTAVVLIGIYLLESRVPGGWEKQRAAMAEAQRLPPPPPPAFLRDLPGGNIPPPALSPSIAGPLLIFAFFMMGQMLGAVYGVLTWGGVWLLLYGGRGPAPSEESVLPAE
jgi:hypothetical protein